ncbi:hypothetical protein PG996_008063 [Apiospora saccharicola]|uniref:Uncharacterized protein n=1 Tax=Apiospora saccharicola TaxID=335842 RepID=A0ABR1UZC9_9PEZI
MSIGGIRERFSRAIQKAETTIKRWKQNAPKLGDVDLNELATKVSKQEGGIVDLESVNGDVGDQRYGDTDYIGEPGRGFAKPGL